MRITRFIGAVAAGASALALVGAGAATASPAIGCGTTITSDTTLTSNLSCPEGNGLTLADGVTLNLGGHRLTGPGASGGSGGAIGVTLPTTGTASVVNGSISNWPLGVSGNLDLEGHPVASVRHIRFRDNGVAIDAVQADVTVEKVAIIGSNDGVVAFSGANVTITDAVFRDNDRAVVGGTSQLLSVNRSTLVNNRVGVDCSETTCQVYRSRITGSDTAVASFFGQVMLKGNRIIDNTTGYAPGFSTDDTVQGNRFARNDVAVSVAGFAGAQIRDNTFTANRVGYTTVDDQVEGYAVTLIGNRFFRNVDGVFVTAAGTSLGRNVARHNRGWGIFAPGATDLGGNVSDHNGNQPQCVGVAC